MGDRQEADRPRRRRRWRTTLAVLAAIFVVAACTEADLGGGIDDAASGSEDTAAADVSGDDDEGDAEAGDQGGDISVEEVAAGFVDAEIPQPLDVDDGTIAARNRSVERELRAALEGRGIPVGVPFHVFDVYGADGALLVFSGDSGDQAFSADGGDGLVEVASTLTELESPVSQVAFSIDSTEADGIEGSFLLTFSLADWNAGIAAEENADASFDASSIVKLQLTRGGRVLSPEETQQALEEAQE